MAVAASDGRELDESFESIGGDVAVAMQFGVAFSANSCRHALVVEHKVRNQLL